MSADESGAVAEPRAGRAGGRWRYADARDFGLKRPSRTVAVSPYSVDGMFVGGVVARVVGGAGGQRAGDNALCAKRSGAHASLDGSEAPKEIDTPDQTPCAARLPRGRGSCRQRTRRARALRRTRVCTIAMAVQAFDSDANSAMPHCNVDATPIIYTRKRLN